MYRTTNIRLSILRGEIGENAGRPQGSPSFSSQDGEPNIIPQNYVEAVSVHEVATVTVTVFASSFAT